MNKKLFLTLALISGSSLKSAPGARTLKAPSETESFLSIIQEEEAACRQKLEQEGTKWLEAISQMAKIKPTDHDTYKLRALRDLQDFALKTKNPELINHTFYFSVKQINTFCDNYFKRLALEALHQFALQNKTENPELLNKTFEFYKEQIKTFKTDYDKREALDYLQNLPLRTKDEGIIEEAFEFSVEQINSLTDEKEKKLALEDLQRFALQNKLDENSKFINQTFYFSVKQINTIGDGFLKGFALENLKDFVREAFVEGDLIRRKVLETNVENFDELVAFVNKVYYVLGLISQGALMKLKNPEILPQEIRDKRSTIIASANSLFERGVPIDLIIQTLSWNRFSRAEAVSLISLIPELEKAVEEDNESVAYSSDSSDSL